VRTIKTAVTATNRDVAGLDHRVTRLEAAGWMTGADWSRWVLVLEKMLSDLKALNAYLRGEIERGEYCKRVGIAEQVIENRPKG